MIGAARSTYTGGEFIAVRREAVEALGTWEAAGVWHRICWRSERTGSWVATIAEVAADCVLSEHKTKVALTVIRDAGWLTGERASHADRTLRWTPLWAEAGSAESPPDVAGNFPATPCSKTVETPPTPTGDETDGLFASPSRPVVLPTVGFDEWYALYPLKKDRGAAVKAYKAAVRKATPEVILAALQAQVPLLLEAKARGFCKYPARWLNAESWADESTEQAPTSQAGLPPRPQSTMMYGG